MKLVVHTLTDGSCPGWLQECAQSVRMGLPGYGSHVIIECHRDHMQHRFKALQMGQFVATVDHDDRVIGDALDQCVKAMEETGAGIAFTYEAQIDPQGFNLPARFRPITYSDVAMHPRSLHHLAVMRSACLEDRLLEEAEKFGVGIDWFVRAWCAFKYGAVQVPIVGYEWRRHPGQFSLKQDPIYRASMDKMRRLTLSWMKEGQEGARIRQHVPRGTASGGSQAAA